AFMGERGDLAPILRAMDVVLVPSWEEPFGVAVIEAMAMGVPVLATNVGGPAEIVRSGQEGVTLPPRQPERWAQVLDELLSCPEGSLAESVRAMGVSVVDLPEIGGSLRLHPWHTTGAVWEIWKSAQVLSGICRRLGIELVHANTVRAGLVASLAARRGGPPPV